MPVLYKLNLRRPCPLCDCRLGRKIADTRYLTFDDSPLDGELTLVTCNQCGFGFSDVAWSKKELERYYQQNEYYNSASSVGAGGCGPADNKRYASQASRLSAACPNRGSRVVDVGCGQGGLLSAMNRDGYTNIQAVDPLGSSVSHIQGKLGIEAVQGSAGALPLPPGTVDMLIYSHVLEHVLDLHSVLGSAHEGLSDDGLAYVEVPDACAYGDESPLPFAELYLEHINHFDELALTNLFESHGFEVVSKGCTGLVGQGGETTRCLYGFFRKGPIQPVREHRTLEDALQGYALRGECNRLWDRLKKLSDAQVPVHVWGMSQQALLVLAHPSMVGCNMQSLIDGDPYKQTKAIQGVSIRSPNALKDAGPEDALLITADPCKEAIADAARDLGFAGEIITLS